MTRIAEVIARSFEHETRQARVVMKAALDVDLDFVPMEKMKPLRDLANHLAQIPTLDFMMYKMDLENVEQTQEMEKDLRRESIQEMLEVFDNGIARVIENFKEMSDDDFLEEKWKPWYEQKAPKAWASYLPEIVRHIAMHKMQLWMYLKLSGKPVDMMTYYGVPSE